MKLREKMKRFWTLDVHNHAGFTLVELIIVIAILAILSTGAIAGYSAYVERANKTADQALVAEIKNVLTLYAYANGIGEGGYVVLNSNGTAAEAEGAEVIAALSDAYGEKWATALNLKYAGWTDDGLLNYVLKNANSASLIAGSTFLSTASPEGLMNAVTGLTDASSKVIQNYMEKYKDDPNKVSDKLNSLLGDDFVTSLNATGVKPTDEEYTTVISNMLVGEFAGDMSGMSVEDAFGDQLIGMTLVYAELYAYCETIRDTTTIDSLNEYLSGADEMDDLSSEKLLEYVQTNTSEDFLTGFNNFEGANLEDPTNGQGYKDIEAALEIMGAVDHIAGTYTDKSTLSDPKLYASASVSEQLNNYISAINAVANMDTTALTGIADNAVVVFVAADGSISVVPGAAAGKN